MTTETEVLDAKDQAFKVLPLEKIRESKTNPRKTFDAQALEELALSVKEKGIIVPPLVRPVNGHFEIVAGARRFRAAKKAGLEEIPVLVRELTDEQALEAQVIENLQRQDVHPLEEAEGYQALLKTGKYDVAGLAAKVGKSQSYLYQRLKLAELIEPAKKAFVEDRITAGHAILIARLQEGDQKDALDACFDTEWQNGKNVPVTMSVRSLAGWIHDSVIMNLSGAPWKKDDAELVAKAGPCTTCPKRTGNCPQLFPEISNKDVCTDRECYTAKAEAFIAKRIAEEKEKGRKVVRIIDDYSSRKDALGTSSYRPAAGKKVCKDTKLGIYVAGGKLGTVTTICTGGYECRTHNSYSSGGGGSSSGPTAEEEKKRQAELHKERIRVRARFLIFEATIAGVTSIDRPELNVIAEDLAGNFYGEDARAAFGNESGLAGKSEKWTLQQLHQVMYAAALSNLEDNEVVSEAKRRKIDVPKLQKLAKDQCDAELALKERQRKWKNRVASQKKSFDEPTCTGCGCVEREACIDPKTLNACSWSKLNPKTNAGTCSACEGIEK